MTRVILVKNGETIKTSNIKENLAQAQKKIMEHTRNTGIIDAYGNIKCIDDNNDVFVFQLKQL